MMKTAGQNYIKSFGDRKNDGYIQLSFTLPVSFEQAHNLSIEYCQKMNLQEIEIVHMLPLDKSMTYIQAFAKTSFSIELNELQKSTKRQELSREEIIQVAEQWQRTLTILAACTGTDAHTVGLDAILNKKGYKGDKGLESYPCFKVINLGSQVDNRIVIDQIIKQKADVLLVSQIITHQNVHLHNLTELVDMLEALDLREDLLCIIGGPRITHQLALELGFDGGFGIGTVPLDVANFICQTKTIF